MRLTYLPYSCPQEFGEDLFSCEWGMVFALFSAFHGASTSVATSLLCY